MYSLSELRKDTHMMSTQEYVKHMTRIRQLLELLSNLKTMQGKSTVSFWVDMTASDITAMILKIQKECGSVMTL